MSIVLFTQTGCGPCAELKRRLREQYPSELPATADLMDATVNHVKAVVGFDTVVPLTIYTNQFDNDRYPAPRVPVAFWEGTTTQVPVGDLYLPSDPDQIRAAIQKHVAVLFIREGCDYCSKAHTWLAAKYETQSYVFDGTPRMRTALTQVSGQKEHTTFPYVWINNRFVTDLLLLE